MGARLTTQHSALLLQSRPAGTGCLQEWQQQVKGVFLPFFRHLKYCDLLWELSPVSSPGAELKEPGKSQIPGERRCGKHRGEIQRDLLQWWALRLSSVVSSWAVLFNLTQELWKLLWFHSTQPGEAESWLRAALGWLWLSSTGLKELLCSAGLNPAQAQPPGDSQRCQAEDGDEDNGDEDNGVWTMAKPKYLPACPSAGPPAASPAPITLALHSPAQPVPCPTPPHSPGPCSCLLQSAGTCYNPAGGAGRTLCGLHTLSPEQLRCYVCLGLFVQLVQFFFSFCWSTLF